MSLGGDLISNIRYFWHFNSQTGLCHLEDSNLNQSINLFVIELLYISMNESFYLLFSLQLILNRICDFSTQILVSVVCNKAFNCSQTFVPSNIWGLARDLMSKDCKEWIDFHAAIGLGVSNVNFERSCCQSDSFGCMSSFEVCPSCQFHKMDGALVWNGCLLNLVKSEQSLLQRHFNQCSGNCYLVY